MQKFKNKRTGEISTAYSIREQGDRFVVKFWAGGEDYRYSKTTIEILRNANEKKAIDDTKSHAVASVPQLSFYVATDEAMSSRLRIEGGMVDPLETTAQQCALTTKPTHIIVYSLQQKCYRCGNETEVLTYILFADSTNDNVTFPWDKNRLNENKSYEQTLAHMSNEDIEFYPIKIIGSDDMFDQIMLDQFSGRINMLYSNIQKRKYPMNVCQHCGAKQGEYYIYEKINKLMRLNTEPCKCQ